eukprot:CAMPEP_0115218810 /NCGR_PEP_ID=MMETSP0270-20121206/26588_1 /TAXON_ID=71861 /ORGANISM="Scrippsiella trochoidea, Strain CCMP3099" /LENGTH=83 /DNA_ID=CAMNT_0002632775 /DNA_START=173 /DNA_END=424 /DNA_ORIENTATION=-
MTSPALICKSAFSSKAFWWFQSCTKLGSQMSSTMRYLGSSSGLTSKPNVLQWSPTRTNSTVNGARRGFATASLPPPPFGESRK